MPNVGNAAYGEASVKISAAAFQKSPPVKEIMWSSGGDGDAFCIGSDDRIKRLRFVDSKAGYIQIGMCRWSCRTCTNTTTNIHQLLYDNTEDQSSYAGYPVIRLRGLSTRRDLNGQTLQCDGEVAGDGGVPRIVTAEAVIQVAYMDTPYIVDAITQKRPVFDAQEGNRFLVPCVREPTTQTCLPSSNGGKTLACIVSSNPPATNIQWTGPGGQVIGTGAQLQIGALAGSVQCRAMPATARSPQEARVSESVRIQPYDRPITTNTFAQVQASPPFEGQGHIQLNAKFIMQCVAYALPRPRIFWLKRMPANPRLVANATCQDGRGQDGQEAPPMSAQNPRPVYGVQSTCEITIDSYERAGEYWCAACVEVGAGEWDCGQGSSLIEPAQPNPDTPTTISVQVDVVGE
ncbi:unnamed protein product [Sphagnum balticum]